MSGRGIAPIGTKSLFSRAYSRSSEPSAAYRRLATGGS